MGWVRLPLAPAGVQGAAYGISADGHVVVGSTDSASDGRAACYWVDGAGPTLIATSYSEAFGVSAFGAEIVGNGASSPFRWTAAGGLTSFGTANDNIFGMSANGSRMVGARLTGSPLREQAAYWNAAGTITLLGYLPGHDRSRALAASTDGSVIVGFSEPSSDTTLQRAFRWTAGTGMVDLGVTAGESGSRAFGVSGDGSIVVGNVYSGTAFRWTAGTGMVLILGLINATAISGDGVTLAGFSYLPAMPSTYFAYWTATDGKIVPEPVPMDPSDPDTIQGTYSNAVSADGQKMVGYTFGTNPLPWLYTIEAIPPAGGSPKLWLLRHPEHWFVGAR